MSEKIENIENEEEEVETIVFEDADGKEVEFVDIGCFDYKGKEYLALVPYEFMSEEVCEGCDDKNCDECKEESGILYCEIVPKGDEEEELVPIMDEKLCDELHALFGEMMEKQIEADDGDAE